MSERLLDDIKSGALFVFINKRHTRLKEQLDYEAARFFKCLIVRREYAQRDNRVRTGTHPEGLIGADCGAQGGVGKPTLG